MTIAQLIECILGKVVVFQGCEGDATPFTDVTVEDISSRLHAMGYQKHGNEAMYQGHTGRPLNARVFMGPTFYQRLKHLGEQQCSAQRNVECADDFMTRIHPPLTLSRSESAKIANIRNLTIFPFFQSMTKCTLVPVVQSQCSHGNRWKVVLVTVVCAWERWKETA
jgi:RNA polymerase Rpb2, domain 6